MKTFFVIAFDTFRMMTRRRLFWVNVWGALAVAAAYASLGCHEAGWSLGFGLRSYESAFLRAGTDWEKTLCFGILTRILRWWVMGGIPLLTLFNLASVIPRSLEPGAAALLFTKCRSRACVLAGRYCGGLACMVIPALACCAGLFLALGLRLDVWQPRVFLAVPFGLAVFACFAAVTVTLGVLTRSASASLLVTLIFAATLWTLQEVAGRHEEQEAAAAAAGLIQDPGLADVVSGVAAVLPRTRELAQGMEARLGLRPPIRFRELVKRWRVRGVSVGIAATEVLAPETPLPAPPPPPKSSSPSSGSKPGPGPAKAGAAASPAPAATVPATSSLREAAAVTCAFPLLVLAGGIALLKQRDL